MVIEATITKYKVQLTHTDKGFLEKVICIEDTYLEKREVNARDLSSERQKFIEEVAGKLARINYNNLEYAKNNYNNLEYAKSNKDVTYYKLVLTKI